MDPVLDTAISLVVPFATFIVSEELHSSGVVSVVVAGLLLGHKAPVLQTAQSRIAERMNWRTIAFFLENTVFMLIGLQADWILSDVGDITKMTADTLLLLKDEELRRSFGEKGRELAVQRYSTSKIIPQYIAFYEKIVQKAKAAAA